MGRYDSHKNTFASMMNSWAGRRITEHLEQLPKSLPTSIKQIEKDFVHVNFDTRNSIFTPPVMKMTQSFSRFGREPTQKSDMGIAVNSGYYIGGNTAFSGGQANYYPRGNLSTLTFQPLGNLNAPKRDYDQHWETGGPNGWRSKVQEKQQEKQGAGQFGSGGGLAGIGGNGSGSAGMSLAMARAHRQVMQRKSPVLFASSNGSTTSSSQGSQSQQQQQQDYTEFSFDKNGQAIVQSKDRKHYLKVNQKDKKVMLTGDGDSTFFGKNNSYLNSSGLCIVDPTAQGEESGAGWDSQSGSEGGSGQSSGGGGSVGGQTALTGHVAGMPLSSGRALQQRMPKIIRTRKGVVIPTLPYSITEKGDVVINPLDGSGGGGGGGGGGQVYLGGDPKKHKFCKVQTVCGPSANVFARIG